MRTSLTSCLNTGMALVGASVIAVSPIAAPTDAPQIRDETVQLTATPIEFYAQVFQTATANAGQLLRNAVSNTLTATSQVVELAKADADLVGGSLSNAAAGFAAALTTVPGYIPAIVVDLASGNLQAAVNDLQGAVSAALQPVSALAPLANIIVQPVLNTLAALGRLDPLLTAYSLAGPVINLFGATGAAIQNVVDALAAGDIQRVVDAVLVAPGMVVEGVLNGGYGLPIVIPAQPPLVPQTTILSSGLLSLGGLIQVGLAQAPGPIATLMSIGKTITDALLTPPSAMIAPAVETLSVSIPQGTTQTLVPQTKPTESSDAASKTLVAASVPQASQRKADPDDAIDITVRHTLNEFGATDAVESDDHKTPARVGEQNVLRPSLRAVPAAETPAAIRETQPSDHDTTTNSNVTEAHADADAPAVGQPDGAPGG